jgi:hypothetical protein
VGSRAAGGAQRTFVVEQSLEDAAVALRRPFTTLPAIDLIEFRVTHPLSGALILSGSVTRPETRTAGAHSSGMRLKQWGVVYRLPGWQFEPLG